MKKIILITFGILFTLQLSATNPLDTRLLSEKDSILEASYTFSTADAVVERFVSMDSREFEAITGKSLNLVDRIKLKAAQVYVNQKHKADSELTKGLYIILAILGLGWLGLGLVSDFSGNDWVISLILYVIFYIPGLIYTLIKMDDYY